MPLVGHVVRETMGRVPSHVSRDDLTSAGLTALVSADRSFDGSRGVPFARYAATRIRGAVLDELRSVDWASRSVRRRARDLDRTRSELATALGRPASTAEVASALGLSAEEVLANDEDTARAQVMSLQAGEGSPVELLLVDNAPAPEEVLLRGEQVAYLHEAIAELPERLRTVVEQYFLAERPMAEIAAELDVTESRVSQMRAEALALIRHALATALEPWLVIPHQRPDGCAARRKDAYVAAVAARHAAGAAAGVRQAYSSVNAAG
ncbi:sigma-70 family RNA polymerase sigma factor [Nocardioidaceae bacterium]|nr:sigma-70 family RNA polymerase sigma factor [Nocardioidaceae bacterium]